MTETTLQPAPTMETTMVVKKSDKRRIMAIGSGIFVVLALFAGVVYWRYSAARVYIENADIEAPKVQVASPVGGTLEEIMVREGDEVSADTVVARVDTTLIKTKVAGIIIHAEQTIGKHLNPGESVVTIINPLELHVVGQLQEDKGLADVQVGERVIFTVDAFGSKNYYGIVDEVSPTSRDTDVVFNISDKRALKDFNIKARFDVASYPELKNGMSAKMWILKK